MAANNPPDPNQPSQPTQPPNPQMPSQSQYNPLSNFNRLPQPLQIEISGIPPLPNPPAPPSQPFKIEMQDSKRDWLTVFIIPITLVLIAALFPFWQNKFSFDLNDAQHQHDISLAATQRAFDNNAADVLQRETQLKSYLDNMSTLLSNPVLRQANQPGTDLRSVATSQTLTVLRELDNDAIRKAYVLDFLHDAELISRDPAPVVNLAGADLREAYLPGAHLGGADLAAADLTGANLAGADLRAAYLSQSILQGANLIGAKLEFAALTYANLTCADAKYPKPCTNLAGAYLSGADFTGAQLAGATFSSTDITGTTFPDGFKKPSGTYTTLWHVFQENNVLQVAHINGSLLSTYANLDLNTSSLQLLYDPQRPAGTSVTLLPAFWSKTSCPGDYCEKGPIISAPFPLGQKDLSNPTLPISVTGTVASLTVHMTLIFSAPVNNTFSVIINATMPPRPNALILDTQAYGGTLVSESFKPVVLHANFVSTSQGTAQQAVFGSQQSVGSQQSEGLLQIMNTPKPAMRTQPMNFSTFSLVGGKSSPLTYPTVTVTVKSLLSGSTDLMAQARIVAQVQPATSATDENVAMWVGIDTSVPDAWSYTVQASAP